MKAGKKGRQAIFHNWACLLFAFLQRLVLWAKRYPGFFPRAGKATAK
jgi:hypothetical protein